MAVSTIPGRINVGVDPLRLRDLGDAAVAAPGEGVVSVDTVSGRPELFYDDPVDAPIQLTSGGSLNGGAVGGFTAGSVIFADSSGKLTQDNANLFWDDINNRLGILTAAPNTSLNGVRGRLHVVTGGANNTEVGLLVTDATNQDVGISILSQATGGRHYQILSTGGGSGSGQGRLILFDVVAGASRLTIDPSGNVGMGGTTTPASPLEVGGIIHSTTGGFKFPDNTTQTTAAAGGNTLDGGYDEGGAGVGRTITADSGDVVISGAGGLAISGAGGGKLFINHSGPATGSFDRISIKDSDSSAVQARIQNTDSTSVANWCATNDLDKTISVEMYGSTHATLANRGFLAYNGTVSLDILTSTATPIIFSTGVGFPERARILSNAATLQFKNGGKLEGGAGTDTLTLSGGAGAASAISIGASNEKIGVYGVPAVVRGSALTAEDSTVIDATYDAVEQAVLNNVRTRLGELEARVQNFGIMN